MSETTTSWDVIIIGGGPGGSTTGALLAKYRPDLRILILERERFPRDHIGESQLPPISTVLEEMGVWEKVEAAGFPVKVGATYTWGQTRDPWVFGFIPESQLPDEVVRPGEYAGWRSQVAFQVDRAIYDEILLDHAAELGCTVREETAVRRVLRDDEDPDRLVGLELADGTRVEARWYIDASGNAAIIRRAMGVEVEVPTALKNVAFWDYWTKAEWADLPDVKATRVHIRSLPYGWLWNIRLGADRTSVGLVCNAEFYKSCGKTPAELYHEAIEAEPSVHEWLDGATARGEVEATTDWSFVVDRTFGRNWFLVGECAGFADPILAAGMTLTQTGARELAYTILELERDELEREWLLHRYDELQRRRVRQHMRFAEFWYSANGIFEDIREHCAEIASEAGLQLSPEQAFRWLSQGGLGDDIPGQVGVGGLDVAGVKQVMSRLTGGRSGWTIDGKNVFKLNLKGAERVTIGQLDDGRITPVPCWVRAGRTLSTVGLQGALIEAMEQTNDVFEILDRVRKLVSPAASPAQVQLLNNQLTQILEVLANDYWITCSVKKKRPALNVSTPDEGALIHTDTLEAPAEGRNPSDRRSA